VLESLFSFFGEPRLLVAAAALGLGLAFGALAESSQFCLLGGVREARGGAAGGAAGKESGVRLAAFLAAALAGLAATQALVGAGALDLSGSVYLASSIALHAVLLGGFLFGLGAALTRGCAGRLTILAATGNLRAMIVILVVAIAGYATMRGILSPVRVSVEGLGAASTQRDLAAILGLDGSGRFFVAAIAAAGAVWFALRAGLWRGVAGLLIGLVIAGGWAASGVLGDDGFEKHAPWAPSFIAPLGRGLAYLMTYTGARIDAGVAFAAGVLGGAFLSSLAGGRAGLTSFESPRQTLRYLAGGLLMGFGGVMAIGCSTGQGLSGVSTLAPASLMALAAIAAGMWSGVAIDARASQPDSAGAAPARACG